MNVIYMPSMYAVETPLPFLILSFHVCHRSSCSKTGSFWLRNMTIQLSNELNPIFPFPTTLLGTLLARFFEKKTRARSARASERTPASSKLGNISHFRVDVMLCTK